MQIGERIKEHRARLGLSQDDLAARIYVSRQTISSWENDKTYPDVQSLLLLSEVFDATVDDLIKGDVETMTKSVEHDVRLMKRLSWVMVALLLLVFAAMVWMAVQLSVWNWDVAQIVPTFVLGLVLWGCAIVAAVWVERIKKENDVVTRQEVLSFWNGEPVNRDTERGRRERMIPRWMKVVRTIGLALLAAAIGAFCGWHGYALIARLLGA